MTSAVLDPIALFERHPTATLIVSVAEGRVLAANDAALALYGAARERLVGARLDDLAGERAAAAVMGTPDDRPITTRQRLGADDSSLVELCSAAITFDGREARLVTVRDVSPAHPEPAALAESERRFRTLVEFTTEAVILYREGHVAYMNPAGLGLLGYGSVDEVLGLHPLDFVYPEDRELVTARIQLLGATGRCPRRELRWMRRDGRPVVVESEAARFDLEGGTSYVAFGRDLTERHHMLGQLALADRMMSLATLAAGVAHEINNPLSYVITNLTLLARDLPALFAGDEPRATSPTSQLRADDAQSLVHDALEGAARVRSVVRDLRSLSSTEDDATGPVDVRRVLESSVKLARHELRHRARLVEEYGEVPVVRANETRLGQVFLNLLINAAQAIPDGRADDNEIRVRTRTLPSGDALVEVQDTGLGIPPDAIGRIFDPFFTTKPTGGGTGLGLSICHRIVVAIGGQISVESVVGRGTVFRVILPRAPEGDASGVAPVESPPPRPAVRVLVVDDEPQIGVALRRLLSPEHEVLTFTRARQALAHVASGERFDVILCDLMMPEANGMEFHAELARMAPAQAERVVFLTGGAFTPEAREFLDRLRTPYLEKPFSEKALRAAIVRVTS